VSVLAVDDLTKDFGGLRALDALSMSVDRGDLLGVMGPNGAGKTTFSIASVALYAPMEDRSPLTARTLPGTRPKRWPEPE
jgi:branched-chain amino acid transport system ATP-binding protein